MVSSVMADDPGIKSPPSPFRLYMVFLNSPRPPLGPCFHTDRCISWIRDW